MKSSRLLRLAVLPLVLAACSTPPTAEDTAPAQTASPAVETLSVEDTCGEWNEIVQFSWENNAMPDAEIESDLRGRVTELASKASGSQKTDLETLSKEAARSLSEEGLAADTRLVDDCGSVAFLEARGFDADGSDSESSEASSSFEPAPVARTTVIKATEEGGYRANVTVRWHEPQIMTPKDFAAFPTCLSPSPAGWSAENAESILIRGVVVEGTVEFPVTNGFEWPKEKPLGVGTRGGSNECSGTANGDQVNTAMRTETEPGTETFSYVIYETSEKTPNNPEGEFDERGEYHLSLSAGRTVNCEPVEGVGEKCSDSF